MTRIEETARPATGADVASVAALAAQAALEMAPLRGGQVWALREARPEPLEDGLRRDLSDDRALLVVGAIDESVVGYGSIRLAALHDGGALGRIDDIYVMPEARGVGVGEAIMEALLAWARGRGCIGVDSLALPGDRHTKNFFETHGMVARSIIVHRRLAAPTDS